MMFVRVLNTPLYYVLQHFLNKHYCNLSIEQKNQIVIMYFLY